LSYLIHGNTQFIAHNVSVLPVYNKIYSDKIAHFVPHGFKGYNCTIDPDLPIYYRNWVEHIAKTFMQQFELVNYVRINGGSLSMSVDEWMKLDLFMREAVVQAVNIVVKEQQKNEAQLKSDLESKLESQKEYKSPFEGAPRPSFIP